MSYHAERWNQRNLKVCLTCYMQKIIAKSGLNNTLLTQNTNQIVMPFLNLVNQTIIYFCTS